MKHLNIGGTNFRVHDEGTGDPVLLLHGFPDSHRVWRHQIPVLQAAGYRVIAPDLRGFGGSDKPVGVETYGLGLLIGDVNGILDALGVAGPVHLVGHDWGATLAWAFAAFQPERVKDLVALSGGHPNAYESSPMKQREKSWYFYFFQFPNAEALLTANDWRLFRQWCRHHAETENWIAALGAPGALTAGLNWYRANVNPVLEFPPLPSVTMRTMILWSEGDVYLTEEFATGSRQFVSAPFRYERIAEASHWLQLDRPDVINRLLLEFLQGK
jgi:pimeloyl-ACP methyl ester carboxylesterase